MLLAHELQQITIYEISHPPKEHSEHWRVEGSSIGAMLIVLQDVNADEAHFFATFRFRRPLCTQVGDGNWGSKILG